MRGERGYRTVKAMTSATKFKLPKAIASSLQANFLTKADAPRPAIELEGGAWLLLAQLGPVVIRDDDVAFVAHWHEIQHAVWEAGSQMLIIRWVDPTREPWHGVTLEDDVRRFMSQLEEFIEYTYISTTSRKTADGTWIRASIRRSSNGNLFSTLTAGGDLDNEGEKLAFELERNLRESVGLER